MKTTTETPLERLRHHVTGAIERGEKDAIVEQAPDATRTDSLLDGWVNIWESPALGRHRGMYTWKTQSDGRDAAIKHLNEYGPLEKYINTIPLAEWCD